MIGAVSSLTQLLYAGPRIDNWACWLHHGLTFAVLLFCSVMVTARQYVGDPIDCIFRGTGEHRTLDAYCWVQSTFTSAGALDPNGVQAHPGVGTELPGDEMRHHAYYRWVCYVLLFQAAASAMPHCLWRAYEGGAITNAVDEEHLKKLHKGKDEDEGLSRTGKFLLKYRGNGASAAWVMVFCEALNLAIDIAQMFFMNHFLGGEFFRHGFQVFPDSALGEEKREDALARLFPRVTKCSFRQFGPSGDVQILDGLCVLPVNVFNEKVYVVLWFWYWVLAGVAAANLVYRVILVLFRPAREWRLRTGFLCNSKSAKYFAREASFCQFMLAVSLGRQIGGRQEFKVLLKEVVKSMQKNQEKSGKQPHIRAGGLPVRATYKVNSNGIKAANPGSSSPGGNSVLAADAQRQGEAGLAARERSSGGACDTPKARPFESYRLALRPTTGDTRGSARSAAPEWPWPGGYVLPDDPKQEVLQGGADEKCADGASCSASDITHKGPTGSQHTEMTKLPLMQRQAPAVSKDKPQKAPWHDQRPVTPALFLQELPATLRTEMETNLFHDLLPVGNDKENDPNSKFPPV